MIPFSDLQQMDILFHLNDGYQKNQASQSVNLSLHAKLLNNWISCHFIQKTYKQAAVLTNLSVSTVSEAKDS